MDPADVNSYRPIANLSVLSKLFERVVAVQIWEHLSRFDLLPATQSGFRPGHSSETAILRVMSDVLSAVDRGDFSSLLLLDLSTAFNTVDHTILLERLQRTFGFSGSALSWVMSYLQARTECVQRGSCRSSTTTLDCGVPQGSVLGPVLFIMYTTDLAATVARHDLQSHLYADDTQIYGSCRAGEVQAHVARLTNCFSDVAAWMRSNRLQLNAGKTEYLWISTSRRRHQLPVDAIQLDGHDIVPAASARNLGVYFDADLTLHHQIDVVTAKCYAALRQLRAIRRYTSPAVMQSLVTSLVLSRLDYCNSIYFGLPASSVQRLQAVQNAAARLVFNIRRSEHVTDALICLHWLRVTERIRFKMAVLMFRSIHGLPPSYLHGFVQSASGRSGLRSASTQLLSVPRTRLSTVGDRAFPVAGANVWNSLPTEITSSPTLNIFRSRLKTYLFNFSYPGTVV